MKKIRFNITATVVGSRYWDLRSNLVEDILLNLPGSKELNDADSDGEYHYQKMIANTTLENLKAGFYFIKLIENNKIIATEKFMLSDF